MRHFHDLLDCVCVEIERFVGAEQNCLSGSAPEIQSATGPGNLTTVLAAHARKSQVSGTLPDFELLLAWEGIAEPCGDLAYRRDGRNWRNMDLR